MLYIRIGFFLALRQIRHASLWTTGLIVFVMVLTFLNLVVVSGILVGLIQGSVDAHRRQYTSDVIISAFNDRTYIENSPAVIAIVRSLPEVAAASPRYRAGATLEANYRTRKDADKRNTAGAQIIGIDPVAEDAATHIADSVVEGEYLAPGDYDQVLIGSFLLKQYVPVDNPGLAALDHVAPGARIRIRIGETEREVIVKGVLKSKVQDISRNVYMPDTQLRAMIGRNDGNVAEIAVKLKSGADPLAVRDALVQRGVDQAAKVQTYADAQPQFLKDIVTMFATLGNVLSSIGLVVASITIFIVVFINALTRRKFIGILKGIGIKAGVIEISYIFQSIFYAVLGSAVGLIAVYGMLVPFFAAHPIDFPFSDGILVAHPGETLVRVGLLVGATILAGYIPARMIVRKNTLDSILGRN